MPSCSEEFAIRNPALAMAVLAHCEARFTNPKLEDIENPGGYIRVLFEDPIRYGFREVNGRWVETSKKTIANERRRADNAQRVRDNGAAQAAEREAERARHEKEMALVDARRKHWHARPEATKIYIRQLIRSRGGLWDQPNDDSPTFIDACENLAEELEREGKL
jgi:hypothetical protein